MSLPLSLTKGLIGWLSIGAMIDNNVKAMARLADHHYILDKGRTVWDGDSASLLETPDLTARYLGV